MRPALAVFVKTPGLSPVKTRLARGIGKPAGLPFPELAAETTAEIVAACCAAIQPYWALAEDDPLAYSSWTGFPCILQGTGALGERMYRVHRELQAKHGASLMIGTNIPQLTTALILDAVETLTRPDVDHILGPANDGGFWLFGSKRAIGRDIWCRVPYSAERTAEALRNELADNGHLACVQTLTDIDTAADLENLRKALSSLPEPTPAQCELSAWLNTLSRPRARR